MADNDGSGERDRISFFDTLFGIRVRRLQGLFGGHWQRWFRARGATITPVQGGVLLSIRSNPGISQITLSRLMGIEPPTLVQTLEPLLRQELVARRRSPADGRVFELSLTLKGEETATLVECETPLHEADLLRYLDSDERQQLLRLLDKAIAGGESALTEKDAGTARSA